jgi:hypothetical protein
MHAIYGLQAIEAEYFDFAYRLDDQGQPIPCPSGDTKSSKGLFLHEMDIDHKPVMVSTNLIFIFASAGLATDFCKRYQSKFKSLGNLLAPEQQRNGVVAVKLQSLHNPQYRTNILLQSIMEVYALPSTITVRFPNPALDDYRSCVLFPQDYSTVVIQTNDSQDLGLGYTPFVKKRTEFYVKRNHVLLDEIKQSANKPHGSTLNELETFTESMMFFTTWIYQRN